MNLARKFTNFKLVIVTNNNFPPIEMYVYYWMIYFIWLTVQKNRCHRLLDAKDGMFTFLSKFVYNIAFPATWIRTCTTLSNVILDKIPSSFTLEICGPDGYFIFYRWHRRWFSYSVSLRFTADLCQNHVVDCNRPAILYVTWPHTWQHFTEFDATRLKSVYLSVLICFYQQIQWLIVWNFTNHSMWL